MNNTEDKYGWLAAQQAHVSLKHEVDKVIVFERAGLLFVFNFHPTKSFSDYRIGVEEAGEYHVVLSTDDKRFGGFENVDVSVKYETTPLEWNDRKNWTQVCSRITSVRRVSLTGRPTGLHTLKNRHNPRERNGLKTAQRVNYLWSGSSLSNHRFSRCAR